MLKGFDDFLQAIAPILGKKQDERESSPDVMPNSQVH